MDPAVRRGETTSAVSWQRQRWRLQRPSWLIQSSLRQLMLQRHTTTRMKQPQPWSLPLLHSLRTADHRARMRGVCSASLSQFGRAQRQLDDEHAAVDEAALAKNGGILLQSLHFRQRCIFNLERMAV